MVLRRRRYSQRDLRLKITKALLLVRSYVARLSMHVSRLDKRKSLIEKRVKEALLLGDEALALKLNEELRYVESILASLTRVKFILEYASLRLETITELNAAYANLLSVKTAIAKLRESDVTAMPEIGAMLAEVDNMFSDILAYTFVPSESLDAAYAEASEEAKRVLREAEELAKRASHAHHS